MSCIPQCQMPKLQITEIGRKRVKSLDFSMMVHDMMADEDADTEDVMFRTALLLCAARITKYKCPPEQCLALTIAI